MGRLRKDARQIKKAVTIFISDEELFRIRQIAQTWGTNVSQMVAHLINQTFESKAYLNGYDELSQDQREGLKARRAHVNFLTSRRSESARIRNFDRRNGLDRGLTNVMVIAAPQSLSGLEGKGFPGIFCKNLGDVWIVPYGLLDRISVIEIIEYPCYASVFDYFAGKQIPTGALSDFVGSKRDYILSSFGEKAVLKRLFELYGHLRFPAVRQAEPILREQRNELTNRITQYERLMHKLKEVQAQKAINAKILEQIKYGHLKEEGLLDNEGKLFDLSKSIEEIRAIYNQGAINNEELDSQEDSKTLSPHETLKVLQSMMPEGDELDEQTLKRLKSLADGQGEPTVEYFEQLKAQIDTLYQDLDTYYDEQGELIAHHMLDEAKSANTFYQSTFNQAKDNYLQIQKAQNSTNDSNHLANNKDDEQRHEYVSSNNVDDEHTQDTNLAKFTNDSEITDNYEQQKQDEVVIFEYVSPHETEYVQELNKSKDSDSAKTCDISDDNLHTNHKDLLQSANNGAINNNLSLDNLAFNEDSIANDGDEPNDDITQITTVKRKRGRPAKPKPKVTRIVLPKYLASKAQDMASRLSEHVDKLKEQGNYPHTNSQDSNDNLRPMPQMYNDEQENKPFMPNQDFSDYNINVKSGGKSDFSLGAKDIIKAQDNKQEQDPS